MSIYAVHAHEQIKVVKGKLVNLCCAHEQIKRENLSIYAVHAHEQIKLVKGKLVKENLIVCAGLILRLASGNPALGSAY